MFRGARFGAIFPTGRAFGFALALAFGFACAVALALSLASFLLLLPSLPLGPGRLLLHQSRPLLPVVGLLEQIVL